MSNAAANLRRRSFLEVSARDRVLALLDPGTFRELCGPRERVTSPHLAALDLPVTFDDGVVTGSGTMDGQHVLIAAQEGAFMGGSVGEVHGAKITGLLERALDKRPAGVVLLLESGGVRLHEANAGLIAMGEIQRAVLGVRRAGIPVIVVIGGSNGCYGGMSIIARCCDAIIMSEEGRLSVSGPEVIETAAGIEEFDSRDRALVWRTMGGKHRRLLGEANRLVADDLAAFRNAVLLHLNRPEPLDLEAVEREHQQLTQRLALFGDCEDAVEIWARLGINNPLRVPDLDVDEFNALVEGLARREASQS